MDTLIMTVIIAAALVVIVMAVLRMRLRSPRSGHALILSSMSREPQVCFTRVFVWPIIMKAEEISTTIQTVQVGRSGDNGYYCRDNIKVEATMTFSIRVNPDKRDILKVVQNVGAARATCVETLTALFGARFSEAAATAFKQQDFEELMGDRERLRHHIIDIIGADLDGFILDDMSIDHIAQTPLERLDPNNILEAQGIRKITEIVERERVYRLEIKVDAEKRAAQLQLEAEELRLKREREQAALIQRYEQEASHARIEAEREMALAQAKADEAVELARVELERAQDRARVEAERDQDLALIDAAREEELARIEAERQQEVARIEERARATARIEAERRELQAKTITKAKQDALRKLQSAHEAKAHETQADEAVAPAVAQEEASDDAHDDDTSAATSSSDEATLAATTPQPPNPGTTTPQAQAATDDDAPSDETHASAPDISADAQEADDEHALDFGLNVEMPDERFEIQTWDDLEPG